MNERRSSTRGRLFRVHPQEWLWVTLWSFVILAFTSVPYVACALQETPEHRFGGLVYDVGDIYTYLAEMRQGARGEWLLHLPFTSEDHQRAWIHSLYILLGKAGRLLGMQPLITYHAARVLSGLVLLGMIYAFCAYFTPRRPLRRLAFLLTGLSSGLGWLILIFGGDRWLGDAPIDFWVPEAYTLPIIYGFPHISLSVAFLLLALMSYLHGVEQARWSWAVAAGGATLVLIALVPFDAAIVWAAMAAYIAARWMRERQWPKRAVGLAAIVALISTPGMLYNVWVFTCIPAFREWARQNPGFSPHPLHFIVSLAFLVLLAVPGMSWAVRHGPARWLLPAGWVPVALFLVYMPFNLQRRLIAGLHPALCLLATVGLVRVILPAFLRWKPVREALRSSTRYSRQGVRRLILYATLLFTLPSNLLLLAGPMIQASQHQEPLYQSADKVAAVEWLALHSRPADVVLCTTAEGNYIPAHSDNWVYVGHEAITSDYARKAAEVASFFGGQMSPDEMRDFLQRNRIAYIYDGPQERQLGPVDLSRQPFLRLVYSNETVSIYQVIERETSSTNKESIHKERVRQEPWATVRMGDTGG